jgi:hypothetical protein
MSERTRFLWQRSGHLKLVGVSIGDWLKVLAAGKTLVPKLERD